ncbi:hypothetical protein [Rugosimonospora africana]|nr:hypothetical protein [Rugosimonospora africana]
MTLQTAGIVLLAAFSHSGLWYSGMAAPMAIGAIGFTLAVPALTKTAVGSVEPADIGTASGLLSTVRQVGVAFGVAATSAAFTAAGGYTTALTVAAGYAACPGSIRRHSRIVRCRSVLAPAGGTKLRHRAATIPPGQRRV